MSPGLSAPISSTKAFGYLSGSKNTNSPLRMFPAQRRTFLFAARPPKIVRGRPISVLRFCSFRRTLPGHRSFNTVYTASLVEDFPTEPVTPTTKGLYFQRIARVKCLRIYVIPLFLFLRLFSKSLNQ